MAHCTWSGDCAWIIPARFPVGVGFENHSAHPLPGQLHIYVGDQCEAEIVMTYGVCSISSRYGPLSLNHFATIVQGGERLAEVGERCLMEGAQEFILEAISGTGPP